MKWSKKGLGIAVLGASAALVLAGCSSDGGNAGGSGGGSGDDGYKIAFVQGVAGDEFYISMECGIKEAAEAAGATVSVQGPEKFDPTLQKPLVDSVVASKPDALLVAPTDVTAMAAPIQAAADAGIKVVLVDTTLEDPSMAVSQISSDNEGGGAAAFDAIKEAHPDGGKVLVVSIDPGISTSDARAAGFEAAAAEDENFEFLGIQYSHNEPATAAEIVTAALQKDPDIVGIFAANLFAAEGTATGVQQAGKTGDVTIVGFDAGPAQVEQLRGGIVQALVAQEPATIGKDGVEQAIAALEGETVEEKIQTGFTIITQDNIDGEGADAAYRSSC
ncbi:MULTISPECIES: ABC transporter substrate-binding protein [Microbacterium]|uniref:Ribose ABC transporter substrate-binding protein n=1 Tax=Microbacterium wangchenii TaxID=2541726 RepID=A0ABX5SVE2_9MICO|nr:MULTISPECIES: ABC transporter substrate-binding protein [Microbacterium]MCK6065844.1 substrate-binding domain-containing protein [Microbacterium sp. EYE_512]QBR90150.1 ribose ABC transporter substrate-binding protein [Microbacterium wangchenii]TFV85040.1 ribose ABC transporter substrate-binding protein [Microbacterium sp. dk485]TXK11834.1 substrate-binding domain-containing protein [Microbacterium wangchenii]